jgi:three-Cys-motif partner protein
MASSNNNEIISEAKPHTIKKFELIEAYTEAWAHKLLEYGRNTGNCNGLVFIDCMSNSGVYHDINGEVVEGTPIRVARVLAEIMRERPYQQQQAWLYFNDLSAEKIDELKKHLPADTHNFHIETSVGDGNDLIKNIGSRLSFGLKINYLLVYDPYEALVDWSAIMPFFRNWGEVIINHMVSDPVRAVSQVKNPEAISKYEQTYLAKIDELLAFGSNRTAYEERFEQIIRALRGNSKYRYYIASYPFFNGKNALVYDLIHCTTNVEGFKLYKSTAWKTFGHKSSTKVSHVNPEQITFDFDEEAGEMGYTTDSDQNCYVVQDIVKFIEEKFAKQHAVPLDTIWSAVDEHPVFPSDLFKNEIKSILKAHGCKVHRSAIDFDCMEDDQ